MPKPVLCCAQGPYCPECWEKWLKYRCEAFLAQPLTVPERYTGSAYCSYNGGSVHIMQIGLGTFGTFIQRDERWIETLLYATSWEKGEELRGIGVDCIEEVLGPLEKIVAKNGGRISVMLGAVGETPGSVPLFCVPPHARATLRKKLEADDAPEWRRADVDAVMAYLENMSSIGSSHVDFEYNAEKVKRQAGTDMNLLEERSVPVYTYAGVLEYHKCTGCEILVVDAEGGDCAILRSMIKSCKAEETNWPCVIRFETRGLGDAKEGPGTEESMIKQLQGEGYMLLDVGGDATLVFRDAFWHYWRLRRWADFHFKLKCYVCAKETWPSSPTFEEDMGLGYSRWRGTLELQKLGEERNQYQKWCCSDCMTSSSTESKRKRED